MARSRAKHTQSSVLRIIGGQWRGRKIPFHPAPGLRPTSDRVRETLFNWLAADVHGARCVDLFAGTGALGLEALSRGAAHCTFVEPNASTLAGIAAALRTLDAESMAQVTPGPAAAFCDQAPGPFDILFIDPPFAAGLVEGCCQEIEAHGLVADGAAIYVEMSGRDDAPVVPQRWTLWRDKQAGEVAYRLYRAGEA